MIKQRLLAILFAGSAALLAAETIPETQAPVQLSIQFHDQHLYYANDEVLVKLTVSNQSPEVFRFRLADQRIFSVDFGVQTLTNQAAKPSEEYTKVLSNNMPVFTRDVSILPGESYSFVEKLNDYKQLNSGLYVVTGYVYPELRYNGSAVPLVSNRLSLDVRPDSRRQNMVEETVSQQVRGVLKAQALPPDQVVTYTLNARMKSQREAYFLYLDTEKLYVGEPRRGESYRRMSEQDRQSTIDKFKEGLWNQKTGDNLAMIPSTFQITKTSYDDNTAFVDVIQKYRPVPQPFTEIKLYHYKLQKRDQVWYIIDYSVTNKGTE